MLLASLNLFCFLFGVRVCFKIRENKIQRHKSHKMHYGLIHPERKPALGSSHLLKTCPLQSLQRAARLLGTEGVLSASQNTEKAQPLKLFPSKQESRGDRREARLCILIRGSHRTSELYLHRNWKPKQSAEPGHRTISDRTC